MTAKHYRATGEAAYQMIEETIETHLQKIKKLYSFCLFREGGIHPEFGKGVLRKIRYLFILEKVAWARSPKERLRIRKEKQSVL